MSMKPYDGDFDALTGAIFASWFSLGPKGPAAYAVGFAETTDRPWSLFYRGMRPTGATTNLGAAVDQEIGAADDFFEVFFNLLLGLNNYFIFNGGEEPLLSEIPAIVRTNGNPAVDAALSWMIGDSGRSRTTDWGRELYLRATCGAGGFAGEQFSAAYAKHAKRRQTATSDAQFARWSPTGPMSSRRPSSSPGPGSKRVIRHEPASSGADSLGTTGGCPTPRSHASSRIFTCRFRRPRSTSNRCLRACGGTRPALSRVRKDWM